MMKFSKNLVAVTCLSAFLLLVSACGGEGVSKIAFSSGGNIFVMNSDGSNQRQLTSSNNSAENTPSWSPDGSKIAFVSDKSGNSKIFVINADGSNQIQLTYNNYNDSSPSWSPDGSKIAFISNRNGDSKIFVMNADGSNQKQLAERTRLVSSPIAWSPNGSEIAFNAFSDDGQPKIFVMNADGSNETQVTFGHWWDYSPSWSPDGSKIAFSSYRNDFSGVDIFTMNSDGSNVTQLTFNDSNDGDPSWSPDGSKIAFTARRDGDDDEIFVIDSILNSDGFNQTQLTFSRYDDSNPSWSPANQPNSARSGESDEVIDYAVVVKLNPVGASYSNLVDDAFTKWAELNPHIRFREVGTNNSSLDLLFTFEDITVTEDYVGLWCWRGCDSYTNYAEIVIDVGDNVCNPNPWQSPARIYSSYVYKFLLDTTMHEIGHHLGLEHHTSEYHLLYSQGDSEAVDDSNYDTLGFVIPQQQIRPNEEHVLALAQLDKRIDDLSFQLDLYTPYDGTPSSRYLRLVDEHDSLVRHWNANCLS